MNTREKLLYVAMAAGVAICWGTLLALLFLSGCAGKAPAPGPPILSPAVDVQSLVPPPAPPVVVPSWLQRYEDIQVGTGRCPGLPRGVLVSEPRYVENIQAYQERDRLRLETAALAQLRTSEREQCESLLQSQRLELVLVAREAASAKRWAAWKLAAGVGLGLAMGFAAGRLSR